MKLSKTAAVLLVAITLLAVGALAGQLHQPDPAGAADNSGAMLAQLHVMNSKLDTLNRSIGSSQYSTSGLRGEINDGLKVLCQSVANADNNGFAYCR